MNWFSNWLFVSRQQPVKGGRILSLFQRPALVMNFGLFFFREADSSALQERSWSRDLHSFCFHISTWLVHNRRAAAGSLSISKSRMLQCGAAGKQFYLSLFFYPLGSF
jgi:hypothetical protein